jgi:hypothetical protein
MPQPTNATKAIVIALVNALFALAVTFDVVLTPAQQGAIFTVVNLAMAAYVSLTFEKSPRRLPDEKVSTVALR